VRPVSNARGTDFHQRRYAVGTEQETEMKILMTPLIVLAAGISLAACEKKAADVQADAVRDQADTTASTMENKADIVENTGADQAAAVEGATDNKADAMRDQADAVKDNAEQKADAIEAGDNMATTTTDTTATTTRK
jgi:hypothetical protein